MISYYPKYPTRPVISLDGAWQFSLYEGKFLEEITPDFPAEDRMCVPGAFDATPAYFCKRGTAVYRKEFSLEQSSSRLLVRIGGLGLRARFYLDGTPVFYTALPYSAESFELADVSAGNHTLTVLVDNMFSPEHQKLFLPGYDFFGFGGFYRSMELRPLPLRNALERAQVRTLCLKTGKISVTLIFRGETDQEITCTASFDNRQETTEYRLKPVNGRATFETTVSDFKIWSPQQPALHTLTVQTGEDCLVERFGIRTIKAKNRKLYLNGKELYLKGVNRHETHPDTGPATSLITQVSDLQLLKSINVNFIRGSHYSQDQRFLDLCDELGFLVWEESLGWGNSPEELADPVFMDLQEQQTRLMVQNSINHPSVIFWAFLNEFASDSQAGYQSCERLVKAIREEDDTRLVSFACCRPMTDTCLSLCDVLCLNTYPGWIGNNDDDFPEKITEAIPKILQRWREFYPADMPIIVTEMGCCGLYGERDPAAAQWTEQFQAEYFSKVIEVIFGTADICGLTLWQFCDSKSYYRFGKKTSIRSKPLAFNLAGIYDRYRRPKLVAQSVAEWFAKK
ncbi:MAG: hypothetical protein GX561_01170 [Lentisphaerae bacterium]|jgi:beta-glucuronidase|nr:hypothetical protein [Lentisphaerota bacterium]